MPVESHSRARVNILAGPLVREIFFTFFFLKWCILVYFIFLSNSGAPQTSQGLE